jgi:hypothetical protein
MEWINLAQKRDHRMLGGNETSDAALRVKWELNASPDIPAGI